MKHSLIILFAALSFLTFPFASYAQAPTATPSGGGGLSVPYDFSPFAVPTVPAGWGLEPIDSGLLVETTGRSAITTLSIANANNILAYIVLLGLGWMVIVFLYEYIRKPASNSELNLSHAYKIIKNNTSIDLAQFTKNTRKKGK